MIYKELEKHLFEIADKKFADFSKSLSNSEYISIGVKNPVARQIVKEHTKDSELRLEDFELGKYLEVDFIYFGLALSRLKTIDDQLKFLRQNIKKAKSWAITDCVQTYLKKSDFEDFLKFFQDLHQSKYVYERRFCYVFGLKHWKNPRILEILPLFQSDEEYMVMMAEAWLLATIAIEFPDQIFKYLEGVNDPDLVRKTISKISDSFRISNEQKVRFKELRSEIKKYEK